MLIKSIVVILLIIVAVVIAIIAMKHLRSREVITGGSTTPTCNIVAVREVYDYCSNIIADVGTDQHILKYLKRIVGSSEVNTDEPVANKQLFAYLQALCERVKATSGHDLMLIGDLRYCWFLPKTAGSILMFDRVGEPLSADELSLLQRYVDNAVTKSLLTIADDVRRNIVDKVKQSAGLYRRYADNVSKATVGKLKKMPLTIDWSVTALINRYIELLNRPAQTSIVYKSIAEKLNDVDLLEMYPREPYLVRAFVDRIKQEIAVLDYNTNRWTNIVPLSKETLRNQILRDQILNKILVEEVPRWRQNPATSTAVMIPYDNNLSNNNNLNPAAYNPETEAPYNDQRAKPVFKSDRS